MYKTKKLKVILYGLGTNFIKSIEYINLRFYVVGCSDCDVNKFEVAKKYGFAYIRPEDVCNYEFDYILITSIYGSAIKSDLVEKFGILEDDILTIDEWQHIDFFHSFGEGNPDKTFYFISKPIRYLNGLVSLLYVYLDLLSHIEGTDYIPVIDLQTYKNQYLEDYEVGKINAWEKFFEPISEYSVDDVLSSKNVILAHDDAGYLSNYNEQYDFKVLAKMFKKYIRFKPGVKKLITEESKKTIGEYNNVLGVLYRGTDMTSLKLKRHMVQPSLDELFDKVDEFKEKYQCDKVFISTEDERAITFFREKYGDDLLYTSQQRFGDTGSTWIANIPSSRENDLFMRGAEYLATIYILSQCDYLVAGVVAGTIGALIMNEDNYKDTCIIDKGCY